MTGAKFESLIVERNREYEKLGVACIGRYGVQAARTKNEWVILQSLPDFEGSLSTGRQVIFDAKVCGQASFPLDKYRSETGGSRSRQLRHMLKRSRFGAACFFLIHWSQRVLKRGIIQAITYRFPVHLDHPFWLAFNAGETKSLNREDCENYGTEIHWNCLSARGKKPRPDFLQGLTANKELQ